MVVKIAVDGDSHVMAYAHHGAERVGAQTHVGMLAHIFEALAFLLHGIVAAAKSVDLNPAALYLHGLAGALAFHQLAVDTDAGACGDLLEHGLVKL